MTVSENAPVYMVGIATSWNRATCVRCSNDIIWQKGESILSDATGNPVCRNCAGNVSMESTPPEVIEELNNMMLEPLKTLLLPQVTSMTITCIVENVKLDVTIERYDDPQRFFFDVQEHTDDGFSEHDFDPPIVAYADPEDAFYGAVEYAAKYLEEASDATHIDRGTD